MSKTFIAIDLFAGVGGIRLGFENIFGDNIAFAFGSEWDKFAVQTYQDNHGDELSGDITKIEAEDIPAHDILLAGIPCQAFSFAGKKEGFADTRGTLFHEVARIARHHKPKIILIENVKGLVSHDKGNTFKVMRDVFEEIGYTLSYGVLDSSNFGVPQHRERIFLVCSLNGEKVDFDKLGKIRKKTNVGSILEDNVPYGYTISDKLWEGHQRRKANNKKSGKGFGYSLFNGESERTRTITARYYKDGAEILIEQEERNPRKITPREAARLQGFPDSFNLTCSDTQMYKQFGNSVSVPVIEAIASEIKSMLTGKQ